MRLEYLGLQNFRGFELFNVHFHAAQTVLLGKNASGKTAILEGAAVALGAVFTGLPVRTARHIRAADVRHVLREHAGLPSLEPQWPILVAAQGSLAGTQLPFWYRVLSGPGGRTTREGARQLISSAEDLARAVQRGEPVDLPVLAYYGTQRVWLQKKATEAKRGVGSRFDGYVDALEPASNHRYLEAWMYQQTLVELQQAKPVVHMRAVAQAVSRCIEGATDFFFNVKTQRLEARLGNELVPFDFLSDGYRTMVAMTADLAWRAAVLNPHHGAEAAERSVGVVLIDEVELHLHPRWQRSVLADLRRAFPKLQFIVTTHSPQVVAGAQRDQVRLLQPGGAVPAPYVEGRDSNSLLEDVFGDFARPPAVQQELDALARLVDEERYDEARVMLAALTARLGPDDPSIVRARWLIDVETSGPPREVE
ncbi:MAG: AAA family ATPase [Myxococcales bacterium]|nr:AAA family ATPase [Myxococcales bacterium]